MDVKITDSVSNTINTFEKNEVNKIYQCIQVIRNTENMGKLYGMNKLKGNNNFYIYRVNETIRIIFRLIDGTLEAIEILKKDRIKKLKDFWGREEI